MRSMIEGLALFYGIAPAAYILICASRLVFGRQP